MVKKITSGILVLLVLLFLLSLIPINTVLVPEWKVQVVDENGTPYKGQIIRQSCHNYTLDVHPCSGTEGSIQKTDENGFVVFPERRIEMNGISRIFRPVGSLLQAVFLHGSLGRSIYLDSVGPKGMKTLKYISDESLPEKLILPSEASKVEL